MKTYIQITQTEAAKRVQRGGFTLVQENLQTEVIYSQEEYEEEEEWNIHEEVSITEAVYEEGTFRNSMYNKSKTTNYAKSTIENPHLKHRPSKMRKSDRHVPDPNPTTPKLALPQGEGSSYKDSSSKRVTSTAKEHIKFETQTHEEVQKLESKKTQEFSVVGGESASGGKKQQMDFSPHASYPRPSTTDKRMSFAMHLNHVEDTSDNKSEDKLVSPAKASPAKTVRSVQPQTTATRKHRPSMLQMFSSNQEENISKLRDEKEKELERSKVDQEFIKQISREVNHDRAQRQARASHREIAHAQEGKNQVETQSRESKRDHGDDGQSTNKQPADNNTLILEKHPIVHFQRGSIISSQHQNLIFDSSLNMPSPILAKETLDKRQSTLKLLDVINGTSSPDIIDYNNLDARPSANFGGYTPTKDTPIPRLSINPSNTFNVAGSARGQEKPNANFGNSFPKELSGGLKRRSMVEYIVKGEGIGTFTVKDQDMQSVSGLSGATWAKCDRLKSVLNSLFPDYSLNMHATIDFDSLIDIVCKEFGKLKAQLSEMNMKLTSVSTEKEVHKKKLTELEIMMKTLLEKIEINEAIKGSQSRRGESSLSPRSDRDYYQPTMALRRDTSKNRMYNTGFANPTFSNVDEVNYAESPKLVPNLQISLDYQRPDTNSMANQLKMAINGSKSVSAKDKHIFSVDFKEKRNQEFLRNEATKHQSQVEERELIRPVIYMVDRTDTGETLQIDNPSADQISLEEDVADGDLFGSELETHFIYKQEKGRYTLRKNSSSLSRVAECTCAAKCSGHNHRSGSREKQGEDKHADMAKKELKLDPRNLKKGILEERRSKEYHYKKNILELTKEASTHTSKHYFPKMEKVSYSLTAREKMKPSVNFLSRFDIVKDILKTPRSTLGSRGKQVMLKPSTSHQYLN